MNFSYLLPLGYSFCKNFKRAVFLSPFSWYERTSHFHFIHLNFSRFYSILFSLYYWKQQQQLRCDPSMSFSSVQYWMILFLFLFRAASFTVCIQHSLNVYGKLLLLFILCCLQQQTMSSSNYSLLFTIFMAHVGRRSSSYWRKVFFNILFCNQNNSDRWNIEFFF